MEPEVATSCSQVGLPVEGGGNQPSHKPLIQKVSSLQDAGIKESGTEEMDNHGLALAESHPMVLGHILALFWALGTNPSLA